MAIQPSMVEFYSGRSVFVTGGTGFMGKVLIEKLLRTCPEMDTIYMLVRAKKGVDPLTRIHSLLDCKLFTPLSEVQPQFRERVVPIVGDITKEGLGISPDDRELLIRKVSVIFHFAATIAFNDPLKAAMQVNVVGVRCMLELARQLPELAVFVHVSTAYAICDQKLIEERIYPTSIHPQNLIDTAKWMDDDLVTMLSPTLVQPHPNTYTYTKALAEYILEAYAADFPIAVVRPSLVGPTLREPFKGWVDDVTAFTILCTAVGLGALRVALAKSGGIADVIPCDTAIHQFIVAASETARLKSKDIRVYNCTTGGLNPFYWTNIEERCLSYYQEVPLDRTVRIPKFKFTSNRLYRNVSMYLDHYLPAWCMDLNARVTGGKPRFVRWQQRLMKFVNALEPFSTRGWCWTNDNVLAMSERLSTQDQQVFHCDVRNIDWQEYMDNSCRGIKLYVLKESMQDLPSAKSNILRLQRRDQLMNIASVVIMGVLPWLLYKCSRATPISSMLSIWRDVPSLYAI